MKRVIDVGEVKIEGVRSQLDLLTITTIKPQPIPVKLKIVLIGTEQMYQLLYEYDDDFYRLFKVKVDFEGDIEKNLENLKKFAGYISYYCCQKNLKHLDRGALKELIKYSSRLASSKKRISTRLELITDIIEESHVWANASSSRYITGELIKKTIEEKKRRINKLEDNMLRNYRENKYIIDTKGKAVGQINGLSVIETGGYVFGKPCRITASVYMGKSGIINIEREAQMSGNIHSKSVMIISGYLGSKYARDIPLSLTANICFEQLYGFIDGDSASIAELYALLSSLSQIPLKQSIAVTGSLNQMGEVQPVGGVNEKIEGFYKVCSLNGFTGEQGVIIPYYNMDDLILDEKIMKDIKRGLFHIYAIKHVEEGIEILTDTYPGTEDEKGNFEKGSFNYRVQEKLKDFIKNYNSLESLKKES